jgi:hypothetical protein
MNAERAALAAAAAIGPTGEAAGRLWRAAAGPRLLVACAAGPAIEGKAAMAGIALG